MKYRELDEITIDYIEKTIEKYFFFNFKHCLSIISMFYIIKILTKIRLDIKKNQ